MNFLTNKVGLIYIYDGVTCHYFEIMHIAQWGKDRIKLQSCGSQGAWYLNLVLFKHIIIASTRFSGTQSLKLKG